jgi:hypothetical protein
MAAAVGGVLAARWRGETGSGVGRPRRLKGRVQSLWKRPGKRQAMRRAKRRSVVVEVW